MKKTALKITVVFAWTLLMLNIFGMAFVQVGAASLALPDYEPVDWRTGWAGQLDMPTIEDSGLSSSSFQTIDSFASTPPVGTTVWDWYLSALSAGDPDGEKPYMTLRAVIGKAEIWVADDLAYPRWLDDPRNEFPINWTMTDEMVQYMAEEFDDVIYPTDTSYFGAPADRDGTDTIFELLGWPEWTYDWIETDPYDPQRVIIKVLNIRDDNYYDPTYPYFVIGFFSRTYTGYYQRNMIHIDCWQWWRRLGEEGHVWYPEFPYKTVERPFTYEGTVAHEYQHNIHSDWNPAGPSFMNEGCSMFAEILCGYGVSWGHVNSYLATPDNSLTVWGDHGDINILADYGASTLWAIYLSDHYGGPAILSRYVLAGIPGVEGIDAALAWLGYTQTFEDVYNDWRIANLIHTDKVGKVSTPQYDYVSIDLGGPEAVAARTYVEKKPWISPKKGTAYGNTITDLGYDTGVSKIGEYGSDYIQFIRLGNEPILNFDGDDAAGVGWTRTEITEWYSTLAGSLEDISIIGTFDLPAAPVTLTFDTYYDIEDYWDFGFVQVSADGGATWTSLENPDTTYTHDPSAHPDIIANLPGFTGWSAGWVPESFDLSAYAGMSVMLRFRYMTDWATTYPGWWVDNIAINGVVVEDEFELYPPLIETDFIVTIIGAEIGNQGIKYTRVEDMTLDDLTEAGAKALDNFMERKGYVLLVVSPNRGPADYMFSVTKE